MNLFRWFTALFGRKGPGAGGTAPPPAARGELREAPRTYVFGGKEFRQILEGTSERDHYVVRLSGKAGLREIVMHQGETPDGFAMRLLYDLIDADVVHEVLAGLIVPSEIKDFEWSYAVAAETATHLRRCYKSDGKDQINSLILLYLQDFLTRGMGFVVSSRTASAGMVQSRGASGTESRTVSEAGAS